MSEHNNPTKPKKTKLVSIKPTSKKQEVARLDEKINDSIKKRLGNFVKDIQNTKAKQKLLEASHNARAEARRNKKKKK